MTDGYAYEVYGVVRTRTGTSGEFTYTGEQVDATGLQYLRARCYDPATGRFASRDPLPLMQRYAYVGGNPVNYVDPTGLFPCPGCDWVKDKISDAGECIKNKGDCVVDYVTDPWNYGGWIQMGSTALGTLACPASGTGIGALGCGLAAVGYLYGTKTRWDASCDKVRSGEWSPDEAYAMRVVYTAPLQSNFATNWVVRKVAVPIVKRLPLATNDICEGGADNYE